MEETSASLSRINESFNETFEAVEDISRQKAKMISPGG